MRAPGTAKSIKGTATCARIPLRCTRSQASRGKKYMSAKQVMPPLSCSAMARSMPSRTKASSTQRADMRVQPGHQRQVVGQAAKQAHGSMAVGIDPPRGQHAVGQFEHLPCLRCPLARPQPGDQTIANAPPAPPRPVPQAPARWERAAGQRAKRLAACAGSGVSDDLTRSIPERSRPGLAIIVRF